MVFVVCLENRVENIGSINHFLDLCQTSCETRVRNTRTHGQRPTVGDRGVLKERTTISPPCRSPQFFFSSTTVGRPVESRYVFSTPMLEVESTEVGELFEGMEEESRGNGVASLMLLKAKPIRNLHIGTAAAVKLRETLTTRLRAIAL